MASGPASRPALPATQKAWYPVRSSKEPAKALVFGDVPVPTNLRKGEILVKVQTVALNPIGYKVLGMLPGFALRRIRAFEFDFAGVVVDANGSEFKEGDEIVGINLVVHALRSSWGALAEYVTVQASDAVLRPENVTPTQAAGFPSAGYTAYQALMEIAKLDAGQSVFINGGSMSVGSFAIQLAKALGAKVTASASGRNEQYVRGLGADEFFDYTKAPLHQQLKEAAPNPKYHVFLEAVGLMDPTLFVESSAYLAPQGIIISVGPQGSGILKFAWKVLLQPSSLGGTKRRWTALSLSTSREMIRNFMKYVEEGRVKPVVDSVYPWEDVKKAYERIMTGRATGKVIVKVDPDAE